MIYGKKIQYKEFPKIMPTVPAAQAVMSKIMNDPALLAQFK